MTLLVKVSIIRTMFLPVSMPVQENVGMFMIMIMAMIMKMTMFMIMLMPMSMSMFVIMAMLVIVIMAMTLVMFLLITNEKVKTIFDGMSYWGIGESCWRHGKIR